MIGALAMGVLAGRVASVVVEEPLVGRVDSSGDLA